MNLLATYFRSPNHAAWFFVSVAVLIISLIYAFYRLGTARAIWRFVIGTHVGTVVLAILVVATRGSGPVYSIDCIWFNALMALIYGSLLYKTRAKSPAVAA